MGLNLLIYKMGVVKPIVLEEKSGSKKDQEYGNTLKRWMYTQMQGALTAVVPGHPPASSWSPCLSSIPGALASAAHTPSESLSPDSAGSPCWLGLTFAELAPLPALHPSSRYTPEAFPPPCLCSSCNLCVGCWVALPPALWSKLSHPSSWYLLQEDASCRAQSRLPGSHLYVRLCWPLSSLRTGILSYHLCSLCSPSTDPGT